MEQTFNSVEEYQAYTMERAANREAMLATLPEKLAEITVLSDEQSAYAAETDAALFDLDTAQDAYATETDSALFELAEYTASLEAQLAELTARVAALEVQ